jgi:hypothetical protein
MTDEAKQVLDDTLARQEKGRQEQARCRVEDAAFLRHICLHKLSDRETIRRLRLIALHLEEPIS